MSEQSTLNNSNGMLHIGTDTTKIFLWNNRYRSNLYVNNSIYKPKVMKAGLVMGMIATTRVLVPLQADASDGSQFPVGILAEDITVDGSATVTCTICVSGDVAEDKVLFDLNQDDLNSVVSSRSLRDRLAADTLGINLVPSTEMTGHDNS